MAFRFQFMGRCVILDKHISGFSSDKLVQFTKKGRFFSRGISHVKRTVPKSLLQQILILVEHKRRRLIQRGKPRILARPDILIIDFGKHNLPDM